MRIIRSISGWMLQPWPLVTVLRLLLVWQRGLFHGWNLSDDEDPCSRAAHGLFNRVIILT
jgi:hypothetical protein